MAKIKGSTLLHIVKSLRNVKERSRTLLPPLLQARYLEERILPSNWYPLEDFLLLARALAHLLQENMPELGDEVYAFMGRYAAQSDLNRTYTGAFRPGDPEENHRRGMLMFRMYFDGVEFETEQVGPGKGKMRLGDYGPPAWEMCSLIAGFIEEAGRLSEEPDFKLTETQCRARGDLRCAWDVTWG